jgi:flotillin
VPTNEVHIVQSSKKTTSYGKDTGHGNTYYEWPTWLPVVSGRPASCRPASSTP